MKAIEDKKIDDAIKNFLYRQTLLQVFLTLTYLDQIYERQETIGSIKELGDRIVEVLRDCWKFNACLIVTSDNQISCKKDENLDSHLIQSKLISRIKLRLGANDSPAFYHGSAGEIFDHGERPSFHEFVALKIQKNQKTYGFLIATTKHQVSDFEKQLLVILENYKIDDIYELIEERQKKVA